MIVKQIIINPNDSDIANKISYIGTKVDEVGELQADIIKNNLFANKSNIKRVAIQGEPGLRFSFSDQVEEVYEEKEKPIYSNVITLSTFGLYELDITDFEMAISELYIYYPLNENKLTQPIIIDYMAEGGESNG